MARKAESANKLPNDTMAKQLCIVFIDIVDGEAMVRRAVALAAVLLVSLGLLVGCSSASAVRSSSVNAKATTTTTQSSANNSSVVKDSQKATSPTNKAQQKINWIRSLSGSSYNVMMHAQYGEGTTAWIYGYAYNVHYSPESNGQPTFIDMSEKGYESRQLTAIVWGEDLGNFNMDLNSLQGKYIAVYGTVYMYKGALPQMKLTDQSQISICPVAP